MRFWPPTEPKRVLVSTDEAAEHLRRLGWSRRRVAAELGMSLATAQKLSTPGNTALPETMNATLALEVAPAGAKR